MHFIGMLAFAPCARGRFDPWMTAGVVSCPGVAASWVALALLMRHEISRTALVVGGVLVGAGIGAMHYIGMAASEWAPIMRFDPWGFAASLWWLCCCHRGPVGALWTGAGGALAARCAEPGGGCGDGAGHCGSALHRDGGIAFYR